MRDLWTIYHMSLVAWLGIRFRRVKARRGIEIERNPLREIEELWDRDYQND